MLITFMLGNRKTVKGQRPAIIEISCNRFTAGSDGYSLSGDYDKASERLRCTPLLSLSFLVFCAKMFHNLLNGF